MTDRTAPIPPVPPKGTFVPSDDKRRISVATRGPFIQSLVLDDEWSPSLLDQLRNNRDLPLTIVISGAGWHEQGVGARFLEALLKVANRWLDAIWVIAPNAIDWTPPAGDPLPIAVLLDLSVLLDSRIANNLVADLIFLPADDPADEALLRRLIGRSAAVMVSRNGLHADAVAALAHQNNFTVLHWEETHPFFGKRIAAHFEFHPPEGRTSSTDELEAIAKHLADFARLLTSARERRGAFRTALVGLIPTLATRPGWEKSLLKLADRDRWPRWAVQTLPFLYVRTSADDSVEVSAFVWRPLLDWLDAPEQYLSGLGKICNGEMWEVRLPKAIHSVFDEVRAQIGENLKGNPYNGDGAFYARISDSVDAVAQIKRRANDPVAPRLRELSRALLRPLDR